MLKRGRPRVLLVHPSLQPPGGGNGLAAWAIQALAERYRLTVLTWYPIDVDAVNRYFGTGLDARRFERLRAPLAWRCAAAALPIPSALLLSSSLTRYARRLAGDFDVVVGTHNECDYGRPAIQYVHYPTYLRPRPDADLRWYHGSGLLLDAYYRAADALADFDPRRLHENVMLANSYWTAEVLARAHGVRARTVYPPVADAGPTPPWRNRTRGFLAVGRLSPEKEHERVMRIVAAVRRAHPEVTLTIVGAGGGRYGNAIRAQAAALGPWIRIVDSVSRNELRTLMASHRYGIHGMREEHFGMAVAEMVRAGVIVWVPDGGGQVEIIGDEPRLRYRDEEEAAALISGVLSAPQEEAKLREWLAGRAALFSASRFVREVREVVDAFLT